MSTELIISAVNFGTFRVAVIKAGERGQEMSEISLKG